MWLRCRFLDAEIDSSNPGCISMSLSKTLNLRCFSRLSCEVSTRWGQPREGWLLSAMSSPEGNSLKKSTHTFHMVS